VSNRDPYSDRAVGPEMTLASSTRNHLRTQQFLISNRGMRGSWRKLKFRIQHRGQPKGNYSYLSATIGSTRVARHAGR
jgi:hypothetical protein